MSFGVSLALMPTLVNTQPSLWSRRPFNCWHGDGQCFL